MLKVLWVLVEYYWLWFVIVIGVLYMNFIWYNIYVPHALVPRIGVLRTLHDEILRRTKSGITPEHD